MPYDYIENERAREDLHHEVAMSSPYNWRRHLIFELPDVCISIGKWSLIIVAVQLVGTALMAGIVEVLMQELPQFCALLHSTVPMDLGT